MDTVSSGLFDRVNKVAESKKLVCAQSEIEVISQEVDSQLPNHNYIFG